MRNDLDGCKLAAEERVFEEGPPAPVEHEEPRRLRVLHLCSDLYIESYIVIHIVIYIVIYV